MRLFFESRKVSTGDGKRKADAAAAATQAPAKKTCPHRTPQTPFESGDKETTYIVDKMVGTRWNQGSREYLVRWKGYAASADTWEPMENLVGCAQQIREYEKLREKEDIEVKAAVLAKRQEAKNAAAVVEADLKARAAEAALAGAGDGNASAAHSADTTGSVHKAHAMKTGLIWSAYDMTGENPSCLLVKGGGWQTSVGDAICGCVPSDKAGTSNYWSSPVCPRKRGSRRTSGSKLSTTRSRIQVPPKSRRCLRLHLQPRPRSLCLRLHLRPRPRPRSARSWTSWQVWHTSKHQWLLRCQGSNPRRIATWSCLQLQ